MINFDKRQLRDALGTFATGVTIVTTRDGTGKLHGLTANSFSSVSLEPPLVLWSQAHSSRSHGTFQASDHFAINILAEGQIALSNAFSRSADDDKFADVKYEEGIGGVPVLSGTAASMECVKVASYPGGDHTVYLGRVERVVRSGLRPLVFESGRYAVAYAHDLGPLAVRSGEMDGPRARDVGTAIAALPSIARDVGDHTLCLAAWGNHGPTAIAWEPSQQPVSAALRHGLVMNVTNSASGRAFAAFLPSAITQAFVDEDLRLFRTAGQDALQQRTDFEQEIALTQKAGVSRADDLAPAQLLHGVSTTALAAPVYDATGQMTLALTVISSAQRLSGDRDGVAAVALKSAASSLSRQFGAPGF